MGDGPGLVKLLTNFKTLSFLLLRLLLGLFARARTHTQSTHTSLGLNYTESLQNSFDSNNKASHEDFGRAFVVVISITINIPGWTLSGCFGEGD